MNQRVDYNHQPHVIQRYHVPSPKNDQYCRHDQAVYSMWMHFAIFCSTELENAKSHRHAEAEIAAFAHPGYKYPLKSAHSMILPSSPQGYQSNNVCTGHQQCFFLEGTLAVNPFTNENRLDVFRNLSSGGEGSQSMFSTRESSSYLSSVSSDSAATQGSSPPHFSLGTCTPTQLAYPCPKNRLQSHFSQKKFGITNSSSAICEPVDYDYSLTPCKGKNLMHISQPKNIEKLNITVQQSNFLAATSYQLINEEASTVSAIGLDWEATHLNHIVAFGIKEAMPFTVAGAAPNPSLLSHFEQKSIFEREMGMIAILNVGISALYLEEKGPYDMDEVLKRSPFDLIDVDEASPSLDISRLSPSEDNIELYSHDLTDNYLSFSPVAGRTPEIKLPLNFEMARPTDISNMSCYSASPVCSVLKGSTKNIPSLNSHSNRRQLFGKRKQVRTQLW